MLDYAGLEAAVGAMAHWLAGQGLAPGERVASWLPKTRAACLLPLACPRAGLVHVPVNPMLKRQQLAHILADSGARLLVTQAARIAALEPGDVPADCREVTEEELAGRDALPPSSADPGTLRRSSIPRARPGGPRRDAEPFEPVARRGQRGALSEGHARGPGARGAAAELRLWPEPIALDLGGGGIAWCRSTI
ncbi:MAG: AMP-binding protein [Sphingomonas sp.]